MVFFRRTHIHTLFTKSWKKLKITISFLSPIEPGLSKEDFLKKLQSIIYKEIDFLD